MTALSTPICLAPPGEDVLAARIVGGAAIGLALAFNIPFGLLGQSFDYPAMLRRPAGFILAAFDAGGPGLVLNWQAFLLCALAMVPLAIGLAFVRPDWVARPGLAVGGAIAGSLAGVTQAIGLARWVFAVPMLARIQSDPASGDMNRAVAEIIFDTLNMWGGVGVGEQIGQALTCLWIGLLALRQWLEAARATAGLGLLAFLGIGLGLGEGLTLGLNLVDPGFGLATAAGYGLFTLWLIATGIGLLRAPRRI